jgi:hypothetical protein
VSKTSKGAPHRTRLILKDGSYQIVMSYHGEGQRRELRQRRARRDGELPNDLVDWDATHKWEREHPPADDVDAASRRPRPLRPSTRSC